MIRRVLRSIILVNNDDFQAIPVSRAVGGPRVFLNLNRLFSLLPDKMLDFKNKPCHEGKHSKERLTVLSGANADGTEKVDTLGHRQKQETEMFQKHEILRVQYEASSKAWMTSSMFETWVHSQDR